MQHARRYRSGRSVADEAKATDLLLHFRLKHRYVDFEAFDRCGPFIDWRATLKLGDVTKPLASSDTSAASVTQPNVISGDDPEWTEPTAQPRPIGTSIRPRKTPKARF